jgi:hypothetical protein
MAQRRSRSPTAAAKLVAELEADPGYQERMRALEATGHRNAEDFRLASAPIVRQLADLGVHLDSLSDLPKLLNALDHRTITALLQWIPRVVNPHVKEELVRTLSDPRAKPEAAPVFLQEFKKEGSSLGLRWALANGLEVVADDFVFEDVAQLVREARYGAARQMLALALGNMKNPRAVDVLVGLLDDDEVVGHAVMALGKLGASTARARVERLTTHPRKWIREEAKKALRRMDRH